MIIMKMSNHPGVAGCRGGQVGQGGPEKCGGGRRLSKPWKKSTYTSDTEAIKQNVFDCGKPEHVALFEKSLKQLIDTIHREGEKESVLIA